MFHVITKTPSFNPDNSVSLIHSVHSHYFWISPYATLKEAEEAADHIRKNGNHKATTEIEEVNE